MVFTACLVIFFLYDTGFTNRSPVSTSLQMRVKGQKADSSGEGIFYGQISAPVCASHIIGAVWVISDQRFAKPIAVGAHRYLPVETILVIIIIVLSLI